MSLLNFKHFIFLSALDIITSWYAFTHIDSLYELNPVYSKSFEIFGILGGLILIKLLGLMCLYTLINMIRPEIKINIVNKNGRELGTFLICSLMVFVVANNIYQIIGTM